ncbi:hypothetical protein L7F22_035579 [Adiantum nelumboides]|nr:hypothetical protein [Adiantum nelumboides]
MAISLRPQSTPLHSSMKAPPSTASAAALMIPGLPNDIAMLCLFKVPRIYHACLASVCVAWRTAVRHPDFYRQRRRLAGYRLCRNLVSACSALLRLRSLHQTAPLQGQISTQRESRCRRCFRRRRCPSPGGRAAGPLESP